MLQLLKPPVHTHHAKHRKVSLGVRMVGIEKRAVPIKQHTVKHGPESHRHQSSRNTTAGKMGSRELS